MANTKITAANIDSTSTGITFADLTVNGDINLGDNDKAIFGAGSDLQIYHSGSHSFIDEQGTGGLITRTSDFYLRNPSDADMIYASSGAAVKLYHNGSEKLATTSTGTDVTGDVHASGLLKVGTNDTEYANNYLRFKSAGAGYIDHNTVGQDINFRISNASALDTTIMTLDAGVGSVGINQTSPSSTYKLDVGGAIRSTGNSPSFNLREDDSSSQHWQLGSYGGVFAVRNVTGGSYPLQVSGSQVGVGMAPSSSLNYGLDIQATSSGNALRLKGRSAGGNEGWLVWTDNSDNPEAGIYATSDNLIFANTTSYTERMRIDSSGKLLIGDSASHTDDLLQIETPASGGGHGIQIRRNDSNNDQGIGHIQFGNNTDTDLAKISAKTDGSTDNAALLFSTQNDGGSLTERMRINHDGEVGIGTQDPASTLHVAGTTRSNIYDIGSAEAQFGFDTYKIRELNNLFYAADKRFAGVSGSSNLQAAMFDGNHDNGYSISAGSTYVVTIDLNQTITYPGGDAYISFYHIYNDFQSVSGRMYYTAGPNSGNWVNMGAAETIRGGAGQGTRLVKLSGAGSVYVGKFEFTFVAKSTSALNVTDIAFFGTRVAGRDFRPYFRKDSGNLLTEDITFKNNSTGTVGSIVVGGGSTAFNTSSDYRLKENILQITNATDKVNQLKPITFNWISDNTDTPITGFLAHEVQEVIPEAVTGEKDAVVPPELFTENDPLPDGISVGDIKDPKGQIDPQQVDHSKLVPLLTKAIQEQQIIIDDLKTRIEALEG